MRVAGDSCRPAFTFCSSTQCNLYYFYTKIICCNFTLRFVRLTGILLRAASVQNPGTDGAAGYRVKKRKRGLLSRLFCCRKPSVGPPDQVPIPMPTTQPEPSPPVVRQHQRCVIVCLGVCWLIFPLSSLSLRLFHPSSSTGRLCYHR